MTGKLTGTLGPTLDVAARAFFSGDPAARGVVFDRTCADDEGDVFGSERYVAVVKSPSGYLVHDYFGSYALAGWAVEEFWDGMRALLAPA